MGQGARHLLILALIAQVLGVACTECGAVIRLRLRVDSQNELAGRCLGQDAR